MYTEKALDNRLEIKERKLYNQLKELSTIFIFYF